MWVNEVDEPLCDWMPELRLTADDGFFSRPTMIHEYMSRSRMHPRHLEWYVGYGFLRLAVLAVELAPTLPDLADALATQALERADHSGIAGLAG
jgi:hypothetical protein